MRKYPRIVNVLQRSKNTSAKCPCGEIGKFYTEVQYNYMRGDDEMAWTCSEHKKDLDFIIGAFENE